MPQSARYLIICQSNRVCWGEIGCELRVVCDPQLIWLHTIKVVVGTDNRQHVAIAG